MVMGGFLVGFGAPWADSCTSANAISGLSNLQLPSLIAVVRFFIGGLVMKFLIFSLIFQDMKFIIYLSKAILFGITITKSEAISWYRISRDVSFSGACPGPLYVLTGTKLTVFVVVILSAILGRFLYSVVKDRIPPINKRK